MAIVAMAMAGYTPKQDESVWAEAGEAVPASLKAPLTP